MGGHEQAAGVPWPRAGPQTEGWGHSSWLGDSPRQSPFAAQSFSGAFCEAAGGHAQGFGTICQLHASERNCSCYQLVVLHLQPDSVISPHVKVLAVPKTKGHHKDTARPISQVPSKGQDARDTNCSKRKFSHTQRKVSFSEGAAAQGWGPLRKGAPSHRVGSGFGEPQPHYGDPDPAAAHNLQPLLWMKAAAPEMLPSWLCC